MRTLARTVLAVLSLTVGAELSEAGLSASVPTHSLSQDRVISTPSQGWALAASAMLGEWNGDRHDLLGGATATEASIQRSQYQLKTAWGVSNRDELLVTLKWLDQEGHRKRFEQLGLRLGALTVDERRTLTELQGQDETLDERVKLLEQHFRRLGPKSLLGWDLTRYIALCRWGYLVGYLDEAEAWRLIMPAAQRLQGTFASWGDLGENYLIGRHFWSPDENRQDGHLHREMVQRLLGSPDSPWNRYPWKTRLAPAP
jgi:hypothetical protein